MKGLDYRLASLQAAVVWEAVGCGLDGVEVLGNAPVFGLEPVDDRVDGGVGVA